MKSKGLEAKIVRNNELRAPVYNGFGAKSVNEPVFAIQRLCAGRWKLDAKAGRRRVDTSRPIVTNQWLGQRPVCPRGFPEGRHESAAGDCMKVILFTRQIHLLRTAGCGRASVPAGRAEFSPRCRFRSQRRAKPEPWDRFRSIFRALYGRGESSA